MLLVLSLLTCDQLSGAGFAICAEQVQAALARPTVAPAERQEGQEMVRQVIEASYSLYCGCCVLEAQCMGAGTDLSSEASHFEAGLLCVSAGTLCVSTPASASANTLKGRGKRPWLR
jgi:hypothetical protein